MLGIWICDDFLLGGVLEDVWWCYEWVGGNYVSVSVTSKALILGGFDEFLPRLRCVELFMVLMLISPL